MATAISVDTTKKELSNVSGTGTGDLRQQFEICPNLEDNLRESSGDRLFVFVGLLGKYSLSDDGQPKQTDLVERLASLSTFRISKTRRCERVQTRPTAY